MAYVTNIADVLRAAGCKVKEYPGWKTAGHGGLNTDRPYLVWHHDASPKGDSPGVAAYMRRNILTGSKVGDAQLWVGRDGTWHVLAAGKAYHAGVVKPGMPSNHNSLGIETDHTVNEDWPVALLESLRRGSAALLKAYGHSAKGLHFHKTICSPAGRKVDPAGLDLASERRVVDGLIGALGVKVTGGQSKPHAPVDNGFGWLSRERGNHVDSGTYADASKPLLVAAFNKALADGKADSVTSRPHGAAREVWAVEQALDRVDYLIPELSKDKSAGTATQVGLDRYRRDIMRLSGKDAEGTAGVQSLSHLMFAAGIKAVWK